MNFFKKNLSACLQLIIVIILLLPKTSGAKGLQEDMSRLDKSRGPYFSSAVASEDDDQLSFSALYKNQPAYRKISDSESYISPFSSASGRKRPSSSSYTTSVVNGQRENEEDEDWPEVTRVYRLYNLRSSRDLLIQDDKVSATGVNADEKGDLVLESVMKKNVVRTRIRGISSDKYLCFNRKGRLVARPKNKARGDKCEFIEEITESGSRFSSALNSRWHIGFTTKGQGLNGAAFDPKNSQQEEKPTSSFGCPPCFLFIKTSSYHKTKYPANFTKNNFDPVEHNKAVGQIHPGTSPDEFLSDFNFPLKSSSSNSSKDDGLQIVSQQQNKGGVTKHRHRHNHQGRRRQKRKKNRKPKNIDFNNEDSSSDRINKISSSNNNRINDDAEDIVLVNVEDRKSRLQQKDTSQTPSSPSPRRREAPLILSLPNSKSEQSLRRPQMYNYTEHSFPTRMGTTTTSTTTTPAPSTTTASRIPRLRRLQKSHRKSSTTLGTTEPPTTTTATPSTTTTVTPSPLIFSKSLYHMQRRRPRHHHHHFQKPTKGVVSNRNQDAMNR